LIQGERRTSNIDSKIHLLDGSSPHPKNEGRYGLAGGLNFFRSIVTFPRGWRPEIALRRPLEFPTVPSEGISMSGENSYLSRLASNQ
jgi:hypothetical protein